MISSDAFYFFKQNAFKSADGIRSFFTKKNVWHILPDMI